MTTREQRAEIAAIEEACEAQAALWDMADALTRRDWRHAQVWAEDARAAVLRVLAFLNTVAPAQLLFGRTNRRPAA